VTSPEHDDLPLRDYDHLPLSAVAQRMRSLTADQIGQLLDYERAHAARPAVEQLMQVRRAELLAGAEPTAGASKRGPTGRSRPRRDGRRTAGRRRRDRRRSRHRTAPRPSRRPTSSPGDSR